ncbi:MAG TPA: SRPBCC domain-containing protein [Polyangiaceae bacterium]
MPLETVRLTAVLPASADRVYAAWLDSTEHTRMTGGKAVVDPTVGGEHSAWDGYIEGKTLELEPGRRIVQSWRTSDFPLGAGDSRLEVHLLDVPEGCELTIIHTEIPEGQGARYESGWDDHYFVPMAKYFGKPKPKPKPKPKAKPKPKKAAKPKKKAAPPRKSKKPAKKKAAKKSKRR